MDFDGRDMLYREAPFSRDIRRTQVVGARVTTGFDHMIEAAEIAQRTIDGLMRSLYDRIETSGGVIVGMPDMTTSDDVMGTTTYTAEAQVAIIDPGAAYLVETAERVVMTPHRPDDWRVVGYRPTTPDGVME